jgi:hypothetical protein
MGAINARDYFCIHIHRRCGITLAPLQPFFTSPFLLYVEFGCTQDCVIAAISIIATISLMITKEFFMCVGLSVCDCLLIVY